MSNRTNGYLAKIIDNAACDAGHKDQSNSEQYLAKFRAMESHFFEKVHPQVDVGLAHENVGKQSVKSQTIMTIHGCRHITDLIKSLDKIAESIEVSGVHKSLSPYESYVLLCAAHLHDVGNIGGRKDHATRSRELISKHSSLFYGTESCQHIFDVARVHGGKDGKYGEDTFRSLQLDSYDSHRIPLLAAILRLGDELSENPERVPEELLNWFKAAPESQLAHKYASSFGHFKLQNEKLLIVFQVYPDHHKFVACLDGKTIGYFRYFECRLNKIEREVRYCMQYGMPALNIRKLEVIIYYYQSDPPSQYSQHKCLTLDLSHGYPNKLPALKERCPELKNQNDLEGYCRGEV